MKKKMSGLFDSMNPMTFFNLMFFMFIYLFIFNMLMTTKKFFFLKMFFFFEMSEIKSMMNNIKKFLISVFFFMSMINILSLFSHIFGQKSMISMNMSLSLTFWFLMNFKEFFLKINILMQSLTPTSTPLMLMFIMTWTELVSMLITSITLMVRLSANMATGHLILSQISKMNIFSFFFQFFLMQFEFMVCLVQSYVFTKLILLYINK